MASDNGSTWQSNVKVHRPLSLYDNIVQQQSQPEANSVADLSAAALLNASSEAPPSQAVNLATTVPVNLARSPLSGRHQPTRASIRHSRMLVLSQQNGRVPLRYLPPVVRWHNLAAFLSTFLAIMGVAGIIFAFLLVLQAPFLLFRDLPFWSGTLNLMAGMAGVILVCWCRRLTPGVPAPDWVCEASQSCIALCICFMIISFLASVSALVFHILRLIWIFQVECILRPIFGFSIASNSSMPLMDTNSTELIEPAAVDNCECESDGVRTGLGCPAQRDHLVGLLLGSSAAHFGAVVVILGYLLIHWRSRRYNQSVYSAVQRPVLQPITPTDSNNGF
ncbi:uncharacterized protein LOC132205795 [Neocloeon triangulifer]|uniref:uncharacterized protein LOC132205795 n=1 Tax=Neocloeon triangulifer TaxID=2078957 RepID=UPI00286F1557|nr:uncharacterized protein LOC132205795 [Neocloeon triangulifer]